MKNTQRGVQAFWDEPGIPAPTEPKWREVLQGILFKEGVIVKPGEAANKKAG